MGLLKSQTSKVRVRQSSCFHENGRKRVLDTKVKQLCCHCESGKKMTTILKKGWGPTNLCYLFRVVENDHFLRGSLVILPSKRRLSIKSHTSLANFMSPILPLLYVSNHAAKWYELGLNIPVYKQLYVFKIPLDNPPCYQTPISSNKMTNNVLSWQVQHFIIEIYFILSISCENIKDFRII